MRKPTQLKKTSDKVLQKSLNEAAAYKSILQPVITIVNGNTLVAVPYCPFSTILFYYFIENIFPATIHLSVLPGVIANSLILIQTKKINRATFIAGLAGAAAVVSSFATGKVVTKECTGQLLNNGENYQQL